MKYALILLDLDETLLHTDKTISDDTVKVLKECQEKGILVGFSTSRGITNVQGFVRQVQPDVIIASGGAMVTYKGEMIYTSLFSAAEVKCMMQKSMELKGAKTEITIDTPEKHYWNKHMENTGEFADWGEILYLDCDTFDEDALKVCVDTEDAEIAEQIAACVADCVAIKFSDIPWYKFSKKNATKEAGIACLAEYLQISCEEIIAFGDDFSDMGMLKMCGTGVAMGNAIPEVKAVADAVTKSNNEDGVAYYLENNVLKEMPQ